jgi:hypothetical protein
MKFFSNEAKESNDETGYDRSDVATSEPVAVPQQRAGSPWTDAPGSADDELADRERRDGTVTEPEAENTTTTYGPDGSVTTVDEDRHEADAEDRHEADAENRHEADAENRHEADAENPADAAVKDEGTFDSPTAVEPETGEPLDKAETVDEHEDRADADAEDRAEAEAEDRVDTDEAVKDDGTFDGPEAVDPTTGETLEKTADETAPVAATDQVTDETAAEEPAAEAEPAVAAATPGSVPAHSVDRLFPDGDAFVDRFREIQLTFVDSPKEATDQAAALVTEVVDSLTSTLREQKDALARGGDDTEQLRVELRGYRDMLNRLLAL